MRKLKNFIDGFMQYTEGKGSPRLYRLWTAIFLVSAACERKVWLTTAKGKLYPNQYILLVGGAGIGKSLCTKLSHELLEQIRTADSVFHLAPINVSRASLADALNAADRRVVRPLETPPVISFNSLTIVPNEFGVFLPAWDNEFMSTLTDLWDNGRYSETKRTNKVTIDIPNSNLNILSATTPAFLTSLLPEGAWEFGFMSRILMVFSGELIHTDIFAEFDLDDKLYNELVNDLREMYKLVGEMSVTEETKITLNEWVRAGGPPIPDHPKLASYTTRRAAHLLKLCMVAAIASDNEKIITLDHYAEALDWLVQLENFMPDIFKSIKVGGDARAIEECWHFIYQSFMKANNKPVPENKIYNFLQERVPVHSIERILDVMERAGLIEKKYTDNGGKGYEPKARRAA